MRGFTPPSSSQTVWWRGLPANITQKDLSWTWDLLAVRNSNQLQTSAEILMFAFSVTWFVPWHLDSTCSVSVCARENTHLASRSFPLNSIPYKSRQWSRPEIFNDGVAEVLWRSYTSLNFAPNWSISAVIFATFLHHLLITNYWQNMGSLLHLSISLGFPNWTMLKTPEQYICGIITKYIKLSAEGSGLIMSLLDLEVLLIKSSMFKCSPV